MIYFVFWYLVFVIVTTLILELYKCVSAKATNGEKVGLLIGTIFRQGLTAIFLYAIYPVLQFV